MRAAVLILALLPLPSGAEPVELVPYESLEPRLVTRVDFEDFPRRLSPGMSLDGAVAVKGATIGERFAGQTLSDSGGFDELSAMPLPPLTLVPGARGQNLAVSFIYMLSNQMGGLGPKGFPDRDAGGEGAMAILFDRDQFALGFRVAADLRPETPQPRGTMSVAFYRRDATLIARLDVTLEWGFQGYGFLREGEIEDIAGITITNRDVQGIAIDDLIFDVELVMGETVTRPNTLSPVRKQPDCGNQNCPNPGT